MENFWPIFWTCVGTALTALFTWLTKTITAYFNDNIKDKQMAKHANAITTIVLTAIQSVAQTFVSTLKNEGKFDENAKKEAMERALVIVNSQLTPELIDYIKVNFGDVQDYLKNKIEAMIYQQKN